MKYIQILLIIFIVGCSNNPIDPLPPVEHQAETFAEHNNRLQTPGHVYFWITKFTEYDSGDWIINEFGEGGTEYNQNWYHWKEKGFPDQAYAVAYEMWKNYIDGNNRGQCGQFAATYVVALRKHNYRCGGLCTFSIQGNHAKAWIEDINGKIIVISNQNISEVSGSIYRYESYEELVHEFKQQINYVDGISNGWFLNEKFEILFDKNTDFSNPIPLGTYFNIKRGEKHE